MKETRREATAVWTSTAASQPAPASRLLYLLLLHSSWNSLVSPRIYTDYAQRERKRLRISFSGCSVAVETKLFSSFVPSFLSLLDEKREPSVGSSTTALPRTREKNIRVDPWTRTSRSRGTRESRTDVKNFFEILENFGLRRCEKFEKVWKKGKGERERENEAENKYSIARFANVPCHVWKEGKSGFLGHASVRSDYESRWRSWLLEFARYSRQNWRRKEKVAKTRGRGISPKGKRGERERERETLRM